MEAHYLFFIAGAVLLVATPALLIALVRVDREHPPTPVAPHLQDQQADSSPSDSAQQRGHRRSRRIRADFWRHYRQESKQLAQLAHTLRLAGVVSASEQLRMVFIGCGLAMLVAVVVAVALVNTEQDPVKSLAFGFIALTGTLLFLHMALGNYAKRRQQRIDHETLMLIQSTRMLWRVGLSLPKTLSILCDELRHLTPECARELRIAVQRIEAGQSQDDALHDSANNTTAEGFKEFLVIMRQQSVTGGGIDNALQQLYEILQSRRKTRLQEKVSKTSANMSIVMMLLLFPALLIVIGGPGFIAISRALSKMAGG